MYGEGARNVMELGGLGTQSNDTKVLLGTYEAIFRDLGPSPSIIIIIIILKRAKPVLKIPSGEYVVTHASVALAGLKCN